MNLDADFCFKFYCFINLFYHFWSICIQDDLLCYFLNSQIKQSSKICGEYIFQNSWTLRMDGPAGLFLKPVSLTTSIIWHGRCNRSLYPIIVWILQWVFGKEWPCWPFHTPDSSKCGRLVWIGSKRVIMRDWKLTMRISNYWTSLNIEKKCSWSLTSNKIDSSLYSTLLQYWSKSSR